MGVRSNPPGYRKLFKFKNYQKPFTFRALLRCAYEIADALRYLHDEAIPGYTVIHRDLKPDNIAFMADGTCKVQRTGHT